MTRVDGGLVLIGPTVNVCVGCAETARLVTAKAPRDVRLKGLVAPAFQPLVTALESRQHDTVIAIRTDLGLVSTHRITPGNCCSPTPEANEDTRTPNGELRTPNRSTGLRDTVVDFRHGPVTALFRTGDLPLATVTAELDSHTAGYGRTTSFEEAERVAIFEAIERRNGMRPRHPDPREISFAELGPDQALDPERLGLNDFGNAYHPDLRMRWAEGWSYTHKRPILVPEQVAYWAAHTPAEQRFVHETSNGCGLGNSLTEAVLHGLFEVAERDAFLLAWYAETPLTRIKLPPDPLLHHLTDRLEELGYELLFLNATNDLGIPAVLTLARTTGKGLPQAFFAAGASPDPAKALRSAAVEVAVDVEAFADRARANPENYSRERLLGLLRDPTQVRSMDDHVAVNTLPEARERYANLVSDEPPQVLPDRRDHTDLRDLLDRYTEDLRGKGLELIAVDQSDPHTTNTLGLHCAKVIVPGTLPMTFGHLHRRTTGLSRLGRTAGHPHPFP
ncbi:ribosomal protein S12 methylthiotransferase accessory factor [Lentzea albidocapillata subsp. violacea]|uniref:Ribosomal protein S12 methylthiotransferase accessory factor n=1 Tax=Lentzea albidocapillata subsp. violacea TaxID=128104 RepID=A0A1G8PJ46_9PSEU|nr:YcaO-like family protein [Lentzea albidocapillata]SDI92366.1 ribosomal protein S12 methylthiotransferase accessory factor [Lentzea albidocapillata subsp. violacea]